jgi:hypothetical protein
VLALPAAVAAEAAPANAAESTAECLCDLRVS